MKRWIYFTLTLILSISLCACGQSSKPSDNQIAEESTEAITQETTALSQEEMIAESTELTDEMWKKITENKAYASSLVGTTLSFMACIEEIATDYVVMNIVNSDFVVQSYAMQLQVYLPTDQLIELEPDSFLQMVGKVSKMTEGELTFLGASGNRIVGPIYVMEQAYVVEDHFKFEGELHGENESYGGWNITIGDSIYATIIHFADDVDTSILRYTKNIKFTAKYTGAFYDARIEEPTLDERLLTFSYEDREFFKENVKKEGFTQMAEDEIAALLTNNSFGMRNNYGGDDLGNHTIVFNNDGSVDAKVISEGKEYSMYESWSVEKGVVVMQHTIVNTDGETQTHDYNFEVYRFDDTRILLLSYKDDYSMVLTVK